MMALYYLCFHTWIYSLLFLNSHRLLFFVSFLIFPFASYQFVLSTRLLSEKCFYYFHSIRLFLGEKCIVLVIFTRLFSCSLSHLFFISLHRGCWRSALPLRGEQVFHSFLLAHFIHLFYQYFWKVGDLFIVFFYTERQSKIFFSLMVFFKSNIFISHHLPHKIVLNLSRLHDFP